jgi:SAM-dependent methyltransferase
MTSSGANQHDFDYLLENARAGKALGLASFIHLDQPIGLWNYIRIAEDITRQLHPGAKILDWGCGYGQMTYLLKRRGFDVTSFDIGDPQQVDMPAIPLCRGLEIVHSLHPTALPFANNSFDAVLSCGVLEHVDEFSQPGNERESLREMARILPPKGQFFIYQLPQRYAWQEAVIRRLRLGYAHPRRYTGSEITQMLEAAGFSVQRMRRANLIPKNLTGMPNRLRTFYSRFSRQLIAVDGALCHIPLLAQVAGVLEVTALRSNQAQLRE